MENRSIWERLSSGAPVDMTEPDYREAVEELRRCEKLNFEINQLPPDAPEKRRLQNELLDHALDDTSTIFTPAQIDMGKRLKVANGSSSTTASRLWPSAASPSGTAP